MADTESGFQLDDDFQDAGPLTFPGFPGVWEKGKPVPVSSLGFDSLKDAERAVRENGIPVKKVANVKPLEPADDVLPSSGPPRKSVEMSPMPGLSGEEFEALCAWEDERSKADPEFKRSPVVEAARAGKTVAAGHVASEAPKEVTSSGDNG